MAGETVAEKANPKDIFLKSSGGDLFQVSYDAAKCSGAIMHLIGNPGDEDKVHVINLPFLPSDTVARIVQWMDHHEEDNLEDYIMVVDPPPGYNPNFKMIRVVFSEWDRHFFEDVDHSVRGKLIMAGRDLGIPGLVHQCQKVVWDQMHGKTEEEAMEILRRLHIAPCYFHD